MPFSFLRTTITFVGIIIVYLILKFWKKARIGGMSLVGMLLILLHQTEGIGKSAWPIYGLIASVVGILLIILDASRGK
jgi:hypothetical protein